MCSCGAGGMGSDVQWCGHITCSNRLSSSGWVYRWLGNSLVTNTLRYKRAFDSPILHSFPAYPATSLFLYNINAMSSTLFLILLHLTIKPFLSVVFLLSFLPATSQVQTGAWEVIFSSVSVCFTNRFTSLVCIQEDVLRWLMESPRKRMLNFPSF